MFHEWDPRRGIAIPNIFKNEGEAILREIALLLLSQGGVAAALEEGQLVQIVSEMLVSRGEEPMTARSAALELLEYSSGRAWILTKVGGREEVARFSFTHRTFFEFFAAEALVRKLNRQNEFRQDDFRPAMAQAINPLGSVSQAILSTVTDDATSVMPELILQAADDLMGGVSSQVLSELRAEARRTGP